jgi:site-specific recombinase XerD
MIEDIKVLIERCSEELSEREYGFKYSRQLASEWSRFEQWLAESGFATFCEDACLSYLDRSVGSRVLRRGMTEGERLRLRAVRMLLSYAEGGEFEFRTPSVEHAMRGESAPALEAYAGHERARGLSRKTMENKERFLRRLNEWLELRGVPVAGLGADEIEEFLAGAFPTEAARHNAAQHLRHLLAWLYDEGLADRDASALVPRDAYRRGSRLPATYTTEEVARVLASADRSSATGRRDYVVLLLAAEYGMRSSDIVSLRLSDIDWDRNVITVRQRKTGSVTQLPLLAPVGNAIVDYLRHGRPDCDLPQVIVSAGSPATARPIGPATVHSIVTKHISRADLDGWRDKRHGAHALRHSLATNMLGGGVALPVIAEVLGHQSTETTNAYLGLDVSSLSGCALPMPAMRSPHYGEVS